MEAVEFFTLSETDSFVKQIDEYIHINYFYNNIRRHFDLDLERGFVTMAESRKERMDEAKAKLDAQKPEIDAIEARLAQVLAADPKDKCALLLQAYFNLLHAAPLDIPAMQKKISAARTKVFKSSPRVVKTKATPAPKPASTQAQAPVQKSLFDD